MVPKLRALLAVLLFNLDKPITNDALMSWLWGSEPRNRDTLYSYISDLRSTLLSTFGMSVALQQSNGTQRLVVDPHNVDYCRFTRHLTAARSATDRHAELHEFDLAIGEFRGEPLTGLKGGRLDNLRTELDNQWRDACLHQVTTRLSLNMHASALPDIDRHLTRWPNDERLYALRMEAMAMTGQRAEIAGYFSRLRTRYQFSDWLREHVRGLLMRHPVPNQGGPLTTVFPQQHDHAETVRSKPTSRPDEDPCGRTIAKPCRFGVVPARAGCFQQRRTAQLLVRMALDGQTVIPTGTNAAGNDLATNTQVLSGLAGVGKTQLAADYAHTLWDAGRLDLLVWITASTRDAITSSYARLASELTGAEDADAEQGAQRLLSWLVTTDMRWLLVLDDLQSPADLRSLWPPHTATGRVIVTTRRRDAALTNDRRRVLSVGSFTPQQSVAYLTAKLTRRPTQAEGAAELARKLGHLPLALAQAAAYIADRHTMTCTDYRNRLADQRRKLAELLPDPDGLPDDHQSTVAATWSLSIERADRLTPPGIARPVLELASVLEPNGIPLAVFVAPASLSYLTNATGRAVDENDAQEALSCLHRLSLIALDPDAPNREVCVHALVQHATRDMLTPEGKAGVARAAAEALSQVWPDIERDGELAAVLRANTDSLQSTTESYLWQPEAHPVLFRVGRSLGEAGLLGPAINHFEQLCATATTLLGRDDPDTLTARHNLARWRGEAGDPARAAREFETLLADRLQVLGPDHPTTLITRHTLARWRGEAGDPARAAKELETLLADQLRILGPDQHATLSTRHNLARWRGEAGNPARAAKELETLLADRRRILGPDHPHTLSARHDLAYWQGEAGDPARAVKQFETLLADCFRVLGADHRRTLENRRGFARCQGKAGGLSRAVNEFEVLLADVERVFGPDHPFTLTIRGDLAYWHGEAGDLARAVEEFEALLADRLRILGADCPQTLITRQDVARSHGKAGDAVRAVKELEELLADRLRILGPDHPRTLSTRRDLACWRGEAGDPVRAIEECEALLADMVSILGKDHPRTLVCRGNLAYWRGEAGDPVRAVQECKALLTDMVRLLGTDHPYTLFSSGNLAGLRGEAGDPAQAAQEYEALVADHLRVLGPDHPRTLCVRRERARWQGEAGNPVRAVEECEALLADMVRVLGPDHPYTLIACGDLAFWRGDAGDAGRAIEELELHLPDRFRVLGPDHPRTLIVRGDLAYRRSEAGDPVRAVKEFEALLADRLRIHGPDHPRTLITRHDLARSRAKAGHLPQAVDEFETLLADRIRILGHDHPHTLATRDELAEWRAIADDSETDS